MTTAPEVGAAITWVNTITDEVFDALHAVREATVRLAGPQMTTGDLAALRPLLHHYLGAIIAGIGFIAAPGLLADAPWYLEWWQHDPSGPPVKLVKDLDPASSAFYDYTHWDWYKGPSSGVEHTVCGPFVDYLCTDEYGFTFSVPVLAGGAFIGVAAADVLVRSFEAAVTPALREISAPAFMTNGSGRVVASNTAKWLTGSLFRGDPSFTVHPIGDLRLSLVVAGRP